MNFCAKRILPTIVSIVLLLPNFTLARDTDTITDWYVQSLQTEIVVNKDSTLDITEKIIADCGNLPDKHGIFRQLPRFYQKTSTERVQTPIDLISITDFEGQKIPHSTIKNRDTITWKIGDPDKVVTGVNHYKIQYRVHNTIRLDNTQFDELYWNLLGIYWQIPIDQFEAKVTFPSEIKPEKQNINLYTGNLQEKDAGLADFNVDANTITVKSKETINPGQGVTLSVTTPKIFTKEPTTLLDKINLVLVLLLPLLALIICFILWQRHGKDGQSRQTQMVQYSPPDDLDPLTLGVLYNNGYFKNQYLSAAIVNLAVKKVITIKEIEKKGIFGDKDFSLELIGADKAEKLEGPEKVLYDCLFSGKAELKISDLKNTFFKDIPAISRSAKKSLEEGGYFDPAGFTWQISFTVIGVLAIIGGIILIIAEQMSAFGLIASGLIFLVYSLFMRRRTEKGAEALWQTHGFRLYMTQAEKYRQQFMEKEGLFEKFLPYAMVFGITSIWIKNMKAIHGEKYFDTYRPYWYTGYGLTHFDANSFEKSINSMSSAMATTMASTPSSSGSGGGGFSGGGGGGGGGGGW